MVLHPSSLYHKPNRSLCTTHPSPPQRPVLLIWLSEVAPAWARLSVTCRSEESHNNSGIGAKEQEEPPVCRLRYPPFYCLWRNGHKCLLQGNQSFLPQNKQIMLFLKREMGRLAHTPPVKRQLTVVYS
ncbi:hypothetical protein PAMP_022231 [Pampus punctatissimus]